MLSKVNYNIILIVIHSLWREAIPRYLSPKRTFSFLFAQQLAIIGLRVPNGNFLAFRPAIRNLQSMSRLFVLLLLPSVLLAQSHELLTPPENARVLGMGGAFVAVADDPQAGILNAAAVKTVPHLGTDMFYAAATHRGTDHFGISFVNPGTERGSVFAMGVWTQGVAQHRELSYYVPYVGTSWHVFPTTSLGLTSRLPYRHSRVDSLSSRWDVIGDLSLLQTLGPFRAAAAVDRVLGGTKDFATRELRIGAAYLHPHFILGYEWRGHEARHKYDFKYSSWHFGSEIIIGKYVALRAGYSAGQRLAGGIAIGLLNGGWRLESGWEISTKHRGATMWAVGLGYRV